MDYNPDKTLHRTFNIELDKRAKESDDRMVDLAFSSEKEYLRSYGYEVLSHREGDVDMTRMTNAPLLLGHNMDEQIGVVMESRIDSDKVGRATVKFSKSALGQEIYQDIRDGIRTQVSVGYRILEMELTGERDGEQEYTATEWAPYEISIVSVAADPSVGVGRSEKQLEDNMSKEEIVKDEVVELEIKGEEVTVDKDALRAEIKAEMEAELEATRKAEEATAKVEAERVEQIEALGVEHKQSELMQKSIDEGHTVEVATRKVLGTYKIPKGDNMDKRNEVGMDSQDLKDYSLMNAIRYQANPNKETRKAAGFEIEVSQTIGDFAGREASGIFIPETMASRANTVGSATAGGNLVETDLLAGSFIDLLRNQSALMPHVTVLGGLVGKVDIPRQTSTATSGWLAENGTQAESSAAFDHVSLEPKTLGARTQMSRRTLFQTTPDIEGIVRRDLSSSMALALDAGIVFGSGSSNQPTGIANTSGVKTISNGTRTNGKSLTWADITFMIEAVSSDNALMGDLKFVGNSKTMGALMRVQQFSSSNGMSVYDGLIKMYEFVHSNQLRSDRTKGTGTGLSEFIFGNMKDILVGQWTGLDMVVDPYSNTNGGVEIRVFQDVDVAVRHPQSFTYVNDIITT